MSIIKWIALLTIYITVGTSCNYLENIDSSIPEYQVYKDRQIINNPADSNTIYLMVKMKVNPYHYRRLIYEYDINDTLAHLLVDTTFGEIECIQSMQNGDILFSGLPAYDKKPGLFVYERDQKQIRKVIDTPYLLHNFFLMSDDKTIYFSDSTLNKVNRDLVYTESFILKTDTTFQKIETVFGQSDLNLELIGTSVRKDQFSFTTYYKAIKGRLSRSNKHYGINETGGSPKEYIFDGYFDPELIEDNRRFKIFPYHEDVYFIFESYDLKKIIKVDFRIGQKTVVYESNEKDRNNKVLFDHLIWLDKQRLILFEDPWKAYHMYSKKRLRLINMKDQTTRILNIHFEKKK